MDSSSPLTRVEVDSVLKEVIHVRGDVNVFVLVDSLHFLPLLKTLSYILGEELWTQCIDHLEDRVHREIVAYIVKELSINSTLLSQVR